MSTSTAAVRPSPRRSLFDEAPFILFWETTRACDLACLHCRACAVPQRSPRELDTREGKALLSEARAMGVPLVVLTGGDPAKREDLVELVRHGAEIGLRMALTPSATALITPELLTSLKDAGLARLALSLDGAVPETHDAFRGFSGSHARTLQILRTARALGLTTQVNTSVSPRNVDEMPAIAALVEELDLELWSVFVVVPTGRAEGSATLDAERTEALLEWLASLSERVRFDIKTTAAPQLRRVLLQRKHPRSDIVGLRDGIGRATRGVNDGSGVAFVSHEGDVFPSGFLPIRCGNVRDEGLRAIYREHPLFQSLRAPAELTGKCGRCEYRFVCGGSRARAYATQLSPLASDPACPYEPGHLGDAEA